jgi:hypothetical protein
VNYLKLIVTMPHRAWHWGQHYPYEAILYGLVLIGAAMVSKLAIVLIATASIVSGMTTIFGGRSWR